MPDVIVACRECGAERTVSEYAAIDRLSCLVCRAPLEKPSSQSRSILLSLKRTPDPKAPPIPLTGVSPAPEVPAPLDVMQEAVGGGLQAIDVHAGRAEESKNRTWMAPFFFVLIAGLFILLQWKFAELGSFQPAYLYGRIVLVAGLYLMVALVAYQDSAGAGSMCLFLPPYAVMYAGSSIESHLLRGSFFGALVGLCTEVYFIRDQALAVALGGNMQQWIQNVDNLIVRASM